MRTKELFYWIKERYSISQKKAAGKPKPWTTDPILQQYRFCSVHREDDTVTQWIRTNWREPHDADPNLWFAMVVARLINWPESLEEGGYPVPWKPAAWVKKLDARKARGEKVFTGAYMIHADATPTESKCGYLAERVLTPLWDARKKVPMESLEVLHKWLMTFRDMGSFMAAQVVADVKYQTRWRSAPDWDSFAAPGPGSRRGLARVCGLPVNYNWRAEEWQEALRKLRMELNPLVAKAGIPHLHAADAQNSLCEFDKMERVRLGEGRPRSKYPGGK